MVFYTGLARVARQAGLTVREVPGWKTRTLGTRRNGMTAARGVLWHHTATSATAVRARNNPTLNYMVNGLGYPLANYALAWDGSIDVIAAGAAAHAGKGSYRTIPRNQGNDYLIGIEVEGTTGLTWSTAQLEAAAKLGAQLDKEFGGLLHIGHYEYAPRRKVDPTGIPGNMPELRSAINRGYWSTKTTPTTVTTKPTPQKKASWFDMASLNDLKKAIRDELGPTGWNYKGKGETRDAYSYLRSTLRAAERLEEALNTLPADVWKHSLSNSAMSNGKGLTATAGSFLTNTRRFTQEYHRETSAALAAQQDIIDQLSAGEGVEIDYKRVEEAARKGAEQAIKDHEDDDTTTIAEPAPLPARDDE